MGGEVTARKMQVSRRQHPNGYRKARGQEIDCGHCYMGERRVNGYCVRFYCGTTGKAVGEFYTCDGRK